jgi:NTE family protein
VYEALAEARIHPDWVAGVSIGAINGALIAGNPPETRVDKLRAFWEGITANPPLDWTAQLVDCFTQGDATRQILNQTSAMSALFAGAPGFFDLRFPPPWFRPAGSIEASSFYDTMALAATLERLIDFERINAGDTRLSLGAVNVRSGNFVYFDTATHRIGPRHVMASGALPPGFPAIEIEGEHYWDGGLVSNTPLQWVAESSPRLDTLAFQVDGARAASYRARDAGATFKWLAVESQSSRRISARKHWLGVKRARVQSQSPRHSASAIKLSCSSVRRRAAEAWGQWAQARVTT